ncbi:hypothetical protein L1S35_05270 [Flavobacterium sp. AS60]|uniref:hypothetical protein n=1 Tax=Flavobacterium anseongense TaxID=2910677 RepID=UPI001F21F17A|nr:hypothetical protein [Flavobacterium sp. AS60]MCF6129075.1 hypothetical protein [Flavobacterium sp. AS60]
MGKNTNSEKSFRVKRGRVDSVNLYEVKENELDILENGETTSLQLNFAIFLLSIAFSGISTLSTCTFGTPLLQNIYLFVTIIGTLLGVYMILMWRKGRKSIKSVIKTIKDRIPPDFVDEGEEEIEAVTENIVPSTTTETTKPEG